MKNIQQPPKWPLRILRFFLKDEYLEEVEGDLEEVYHDVLETHTSVKAGRMYTTEVIKLLRPVLVKRLSGNQKLTQYGMIRHQLKIGWRNILRDKVHSLINVAGLTIGTTAAIILFIFIKYESGFDGFHQLADRTYRVVQHTNFPEEEVFWNTTAYPLAAAIREDFSEVELVTQTAGPFKRMFSVEDETGDINLFEEDHVLFADEWYPQVFDLEWIAGDKKTALSDLNSVVLSERVAARFFGTSQSVIGRIISLNGKDQLKVTGVVKNAPGNSNLRYSMIVPYEFFKFHNNYFANNWSGNYGGTAFVVLPDPANETNIESRLESWKGKYLDPEDNQRIHYFLQPLKEIHTEALYGSTIGSYQMPATFLNTAIFIAVFILAIAIVNFVNLVTAKAGSRAREVGIRKVVGASKTGLVRQFILEKGILIAFTLFFSIGLTHLLLDQLNHLMAIVNLQLELTWNDAALISLIGIVTILLATTYPAFVLSSFRPIQIFNKTAGRFRGFSLRKSLTVFQFTIVQFFVIAAIIVGIQVNHFRNQELGFTSEAIITTPVMDGEKIEVLKSSLLANPNVKDVAVGSGPPMAVEGMQLGTTYRLPHNAEADGLQAEMKVSDLNYLDFYGLELVTGRDFVQNKHPFDEFIINETLLKSMNWTAEEALGKRLQINEGEATIVGVVKDFHNNSLQHQIGPVIFINWTFLLDETAIRMAATNPLALYEVEQIWSEQFPDKVYSHHFLDDSIAREYAMESLIFNGFTIFSVLVVFIGILGLLGLMSFITLQKTKEVGIRKVLGASFSNIFLFFSKEYIMLILIAFILAIPAVWYLMNQWLEDFVYRIDLSVWMFVAGGVLTLLVAGMTSFFQIAKTASVNPVESLRNE
ncbi:MAG: ABC transporter permease [Cyclobacteriaceae bacterium]